jgi:hypothetical protein
MSGHDHEDLLDYEDEHDIPNIGGTSTGVSGGDPDGKDKKNFSGIHATGFRWVLCNKWCPVIKRMSSSFFQRFPSQT